MRLISVFLYCLLFAPAIQSASAWQDINFVNKHMALRDWQPGQLISTWPLDSDPAGLRPSLKVSLSDPVRFSGFSSQAYLENGLETSLHQTFGKMDYGINLRLLESSETNFLSGSYLRLKLANWYLSAERLERWWGPAWSGSLILGNASEPVPGISLQRKNFQAFSTKYLSWLGPWNLVLFAGQLESHRTVPKAKLLAARFSFSPWRKLEFGMSRAAQWGGQGRPQDLASLGRLLFGLDNVGSNGINNENQPGNQLAGFDMYWQFMPKGPVAFYAQVIGEDEANLFPTAFMGLYGFEFWRGGHYRAYLEYADTRVDYYRSERRYGAAYRHSVYQNGYTYKGKSLAHSLGGDGQMTSLGQMWVNPHGGSYMLVLRSIRPNVIDLGEKNRRSIMISSLWQFKGHKLQAEAEFYRDHSRTSASSSDKTSFSLAWSMEF